MEKSLASRIGLIGILALLCVPYIAVAHPGHTNSEGCHTNQKTGEYHCHGSQKSSTQSSKSQSQSAPVIIAVNQRLPQGSIQTFSKAKRSLVKLYKAHPEAKTFYCGCDITWKGKNGIPDAIQCGYKARKPITGSGNPNARATRIEWEHVMPAYWFGHQLKCWQNGGRKACQSNPMFQQMEGDLHNLVPAIGELNGDRSNYRYSMLEGELRKYGACDFEVDFKNKKVEPPPNIRGDIARTYFYMADKYRLKISKQQKRLLEVWNKADPPDSWERSRNKLISRIQGNENKYVQ